MGTRALRGDSRKLKFKRQLRANLTESERRLWSKLRSKQFCSLKFRRQHGIGPYILDFYCPEKNLAIEIDGDTHGEVKAKIYDEQRDKYLQELNVTVVRYTNR